MWNRWFIQVGFTYVLDNMDVFTDLFKHWGLYWSGPGYCHAIHKYTYITTMKVERIREEETTKVMEDNYATDNLTDEQVDTKMESIVSDLVSNGAFDIHIRASLANNKQWWANFLKDANYKDAEELLIKLGGK